MTLCSSVIFAVTSFTIFSTSSVMVVRTLDVVWIEVAVFPVVTTVLLTDCVDPTVAVMNFVSTVLSCVVVSTVLSCVLSYAGKMSILQQKHSPVFLFLSLEHCV